MLRKEIVMELTINQRIARYRRLSDLTQSDVAEKLGMKSSTYSQMERKGNISAQMILRLADIFNVEPNELLYGEKKQYVEPPIEDGTTTLSQPKDIPTPVTTPSPTITVLTNSEENIIKIIRSLSKKDKDEVMAFVHSKYRKKK